MVIKFESNGLKKELDKFCKESDAFVALNTADYMSFSLK